MKNSYITVTDQFCGAGGSSQGVHNYANKIGGGLEVKLALNHWKLAIETHSTNFQDTLHDCTDISACDPRRYPSTDILITSPECTNHSLAKGKKIVKAQMDLFNSGKIDAAAERSRATMWDVCRFAEYHQYNAIIVENVVDARKWIMFDAWLNAMHILGYKHQCVYLNSMHCHPTPQSRDRMYVVFWKKGNKTPNLEFTPLAYSPRLGKDVHSVQTWKNPLKKFGKYNQQYVYCCPFTGDVVEPYYYASFNMVDWSDLGTRIGDRKHPLSHNTQKRIEAGLVKYSTQPLIINNQQSTGIGFRVKSVAEQIPTLSTQPNFGLFMPFIFKGEHTLQKGYTRSITDTIQTQTVRQSMGLVIPHIVELNRTGESKPSTAPFSTFTAGVINHGIMATEAMQSFLTYYYKTIQNSHISEPMRTATTNDRAALISNVQPNIEDCYYRMIKPPEVKLGMAFNRDYIVLGSGKDQVKQLGNAVTPPAMESLIERVVESLT
ncbi:DNA cytosine methyltransferase [Pedobacter sp.]|uniref:DNA cytosine methyltransferase n=1 Tax=Pedobacter sp. TaxID=1411316 RepID=UPI00396C2DBC